MAFFLLLLYGKIIGHFFHSLVFFFLGWMFNEDIIIYEL